MNVHTPQQLIEQIEQEGTRAADQATMVAIAWQSWADQLAELERSMPPVPDKYRHLNRVGGFDNTPVEADNHTAAMGRLLRAVRVTADAYTSELHRVSTRIGNSVSEEWRAAYQWVGKRYFPLRYTGSSGDRHVVIDLDEDRSGYWEVGIGDDVWYETAADAAAEADALNRDPQPYPEGAPRGRYIAVRGPWDFMVVDRGDSLTDWKVLTTGLETVEGACDLVLKYSAGDILPVDPVPWGPDVWSPNPHGAEGADS